MTNQEVMRLALEALEDISAFQNHSGNAVSDVDAAIEALRSALAQQPDADPNAPWMTEAHCLCSDYGIPHGNLTRRIRALRDKLEQQGEQQPVAWYLPQGTDDSLFRDHRTVVTCTGNKWEGWLPLYAGAAPAAQPLSDEKIDALFREYMLYQDGVTPSGLKRITRAIEAAHGIGADK